MRKIHTENAGHFSVNESALAASISLTLPAGVEITKHTLGTNLPQNLTPLDFTLSGFDDHMTQSEYLSWRIEQRSWGSGNLHGAVHVTRSIIDTIQDSMHPDGTLYIIVGENHDCDAFIHFQSCTIEAYPNAVLGLEHSANQLAMTLNHPAGYDLDLTRDQIYGLHHHDPDGHIFAGATMARNMCSTPIARNGLLNTAIQGGNKLILMDAYKREKEQTLDMNDEMSRNIADKLEIDIRKTIPAVEPVFNNQTGLWDVRGMVIRNHVMAQRLIDGAGDNKLVFAATGLNHMGNRTEDLDFATSLPGILAQKIGKKDKIITFYLSSDRNGCTPEKLTPSDYHHEQMIRVNIRQLTLRPCLQDIHKQNKFAQWLHASFSQAAAPLPLALQPYIAPDLKETKARLRKFMDAHPCK